MNEQKLLFQPEPVVWIERLWSRVPAVTRQQILAILAEMAKAALIEHAIAEAKELTMDAEAITAVQRARRAIVYIRQSTERQILENKESQRRQRDLVERVVELGWSREQVVQIDEDLGKSGAGIQDRSGFRQMVAETELGGVGIIIALEVCL